MKKLALILVMGTLVSFYADAGRKPCSGSKGGISHCTAGGKFDLGSDEVATAGKTMCTIVDAVASVTHIMQEIATASDEQSRGITQVSQAISEMDKVTQQNASLVEEASTAAVSLEEQAARLTEAVDVFRLNKHSVSAEPRGAGEPVSFATV